MTLFVSDLHLGSQACIADKLCDFLAKYPQRDTIWLVGDFFDDVTAKHFPSLHLAALEMIMDFEEIIWLPGNHDALMRKLWGFSGRITIANEAVYTATNGKRYLITHGDRYDPTLILTPPRWFRKMLPYHRPTGWHGKVMSEMQKRRALRDVSKFGYHGVICGHSHVPEIDAIGGVEYVNCGDWVKHCTAVIDDQHGMRLVGGDHGFEVIARAA